MIGFSATLTADQGNDVSSLIAQILADNATALAQKNRLAVDKFERVVKSALKSTGYQIAKPLKDGLRKGTLGLAPRRVYTKTGVVMSTLLKKVRPWQIPNYTKLFLNMLGKEKIYPAGFAFGGLMEYRLEDEAGKLDVKIGMIEGGRASKKWADRFAAWQDADDIDIDQYRYKDASYVTMQKYFAAIGIATKTWTEPKRPARPVIKTIEEKTNPAQLFEKIFLEKLLK